MAQRGCPDLSRFLTQVACDDGSMTTALDLTSDAAWRTREILAFARQRLTESERDEQCAWQQFEARALSRDELRAAVRGTVLLESRVDQLAAEDARLGCDSKPAESFVQQVGSREAEIIVRGRLDSVDGRGVWMSGRVLRQLDDLDQSTCGLERIVVRIDSCGGSLNDALGLYDALIASSCRVDVLIEGEACSAAAVLALCGRHRRITANGRIMAHACTFTLNGAYSQADLVRTAREAASANMRIAEILRSRSRLSDDEIRGILTRDTHFDAEQALAAGLVDEIVDGEKHD